MFTHARAGRVVCAGEGEGGGQGSGGGGLRGALAPVCVRAHADLNARARLPFEVLDRLPTLADDRTDGAVRDIQGVLVPATAAASRPEPAAATGRDIASTTAAIRAIAATATATDFPAFPALFAEAVVVLQHARRKTNDAF